MNNNIILFSETGLKHGQSLSTDAQPLTTIFQIKAPIYSLDNNFRAAEFQNQLNQGKTRSNFSFLVLEPNSLLRMLILCHL